MFKRLFDYLIVGIIATSFVLTCQQSLAQNLVIENASLTRSGTENKLELDGNFNIGVGGPSSIYWMDNIEVYELVEISMPWGGKFIIIPVLLGNADFSEITSGSWDFDKDVPREKTSIKIQVKYTYAEVFFWGGEEIEHEGWSVPIDVELSESDSDGDQPPNED